MDGKGHSESHTDPKAQQPHVHVPGIANEDEVVNTLKRIFMNEDIEDNKFTWNEVVIVKNNAPEYLHPGEIASVCGMEKIKFADVAEKYHTKVGNWVYTMEFNDGSDITIPEMYLEKADFQKK